MEPNSYANVTIIGTAINNVGEDIQNAKILGTVTNMGSNFWCRDSLLYRKSKC